jgi:hypothetical protein
VSSKEVTSRKVDTALVTTQLRMTWRLAHQCFKQVAATTTEQAVMPQPKNHHMVITAKVVGADLAFTNLGTLIYLETPVTTIYLEVLYFRWVLGMDPESPINMEPEPITESWDSRALSINLTAVIFQVVTLVRVITEIFILTIRKATKVSPPALVRITDSVGLPSRRTHQVAI